MVISHNNPDALVIIKFVSAMSCKQQLRYFHLTMGDKKFRPHPRHPSQSINQCPYTLVIESIIITVAITVTSTSAAASAAATSAAAATIRTTAATAAITVTITVAVIIVVIITIVTIPDETLHTRVIRIINTLAIPTLLRTTLAITRAS